MNTLKEEIYESIDRVIWNDVWLLLMNRTSNVVDVYATEKINDELCVIVGPYSENVRSRNCHFIWNYEYA